MDAFVTKISNFLSVVILANWKLSIRIINQNLFATTATISFTMRDSAWTFTQFQIVRLFNTKNFCHIINCKSNVSWAHKVSSYHFFTTIWTFHAALPPINIDLQGTIPCPLHHNYYVFASTNLNWTKSLRDGLPRLWRSFLLLNKKAVETKSYK